jgi:hypothetical protein
MRRTWVLEYYCAGERARAWEVLSGLPEPLLGDVFDGPAWLVWLLVAPCDFIEDRGELTEPLSPPGG